MIITEFFLDPAVAGFLEEQGIGFDRVDEHRIRIDRSHLCRAQDGVITLIVCGRYVNVSERFFFGSVVEQEDKS